VISHSQLTDDLRGEFRGRLHVDAPTRTLFATDASLFQVLPHAVAVPTDEADLQLLIRYAHEQALPIIPRGAGTGLAGESLGWGIVVDLSVAFRRILDVADDRITVEAGVTLSQVNAALAARGRRFAPHPASAAICTIGGMIATNASGGNAYVHGYTRDHILGLRAIWDDGEAADLLRPIANDASTHDEDGPRLVELRTQTTALLAANRGLIQVTRPQTPFNRCGYVLHDVLGANGLDLTRLLVGTEGTLATTTRATLGTIPLPGGTASVILGFRSLTDALRAGLTLRAAEGVVSCDLLDQRLVALARTVEGAERLVVPQSIVAVLVVTIEAASAVAAETLAQSAVERAGRVHPTVALAGPSSGPEDLATIAQFRTAIVSGMYALGSGARPVPFIEDIAVPGEELVRFVSGVTEVLRRNDMAGSFLIHVLAGQVHTRPFIDLNNPADRARLWPVADAIHGLAISLGGSISTQHGTGLARTPWVEKQYGPLMPVFRELKRIFDPKGIWNPGKIIGPDPSRPAWPLRAEVGQPTEAPPTRQPLLLWATSPELEASRCHGCGECRVQSAPTRMCPTFHATGQEAATPRAKANLFRLLASDASTDALSAEEVREIADLCVNCKMCLSECRSHVNVPKLALEAKAAHYALHGLDRDGWLAARLEGLMRVAGTFAFTSNRLLGNPAARWVMEKIFGLSRKRTLPKFAHRTYLKRAKRAGLTERQVVDPTAPEAPQRVAYFVDTFANRIDTQIAMATTAVLRHNGIEVYVPPRQYGSGMTTLVEGDVDTATETAEFNVRLLAELVRDGYSVICSEPTAALALSKDYLDLLDTPDALLVAKNTFEVTDFLWRLHEAGKLRTDFNIPRSLHLGHHVPCHVKALGGLPAGPRLLALIPGVLITTIDKSCSGMAGAHGLKASAYAESLIAGEPMLASMRSTDIEFGSTECSACRLQMQEGSNKRTLHPIQYLAFAYGLLPEIEWRLRKPLGTHSTE